MKNKRKLTIMLIFSVISATLSASENHTEDPHYVWFNENEVAVQEDGIYTDSNKGMMKLNVVEHDRVNNRFKVLCNCLNQRDLDFTTALSAPYEGNK